MKLGSGKMFSNPSHRIYIQIWSLWFIQQGYQDYRKICLRQRHMILHPFPTPSACLASTYSICPPLRPRSLQSTVTASACITLGEHSKSIQFPVQTFHWFWNLAILLSKLVFVYSSFHCFYIVQRSSMSTATVFGLYIHLMEVIWPTDRCLGLVLMIEPWTGLRTNFRNCYSFQELHRFSFHACKWIFPKMPITYIDKLAFNLLFTINFTCLKRLMSTTKIESTRWTHLVYHLHGNKNTTYAKILQDLKMASLKMPLLHRIHRSPQEKCPQQKLHEFKRLFSSNAQKVKIPSRRNKKY